MLTFNGPVRTLCNGVSRRDVLRLGTLSVGGLSLPQLLRAEQQSGAGDSRKAVIMIYMCGAPGRGHVRA
ncbi:MAG UNVERIFIED_CONTAM: hypothetical protein LVR18_36470 [Planctomycetaceae bacterium]|jgi:hypothetical protein